MRLPNFFIVGAPKAGTTSLFHYLKQHPQIFMSPLKEPHYFSTEVREETMDGPLRRWYQADTRNSPDGRKLFGRIVSGKDDYHRLFEGAREALAVGEASVGYLRSPTAPERIASEIPEARIIILLRNPADRAFSQYLHGVGNGAIRWSFREHIERNLHHRSQQICVHYPFLEFGLYAEQVARYRALFGERVWIGFHEDYRNQPLELSQSLYRFLGVDAGFTPSTSTRYLEAQVPRLPMVARLKRAGVWEAAARFTPSRIRPIIRRTLIRPSGTTSMEPADRAYLVDYYRSDVEKLASALDRNLNEWLN